MEILDLYDKNRKPLNRTIKRGTKHHKGEYHLVVHICLFNENDEMLVQRRNPDKKLWPNLWDVSCSGVPIQGETSGSGASRELYEELGLSYNFEEEHPLLTAYFDQGISDYYGIELSTDIKDIKLKSDEVTEVKWVSLGEIKELQKNKQFVPYVDSFIDVLFQIKTNHSEIEL